MVHRHTCHEKLVHKFLKNLKTILKVSVVRRHIVCEANTDCQFDSSGIKPPGIPVKHLPGRDFSG